MTGKLDWRAAVWAGLIAGLLFLIAEMAMVAFAMNQSPWGPPRMMAAIVMGEDVLPPPASFDVTIVIVAMIVHFALSIAFAILFGILHGLLNMSRAAATAAGILYGLVVYFVDFYIFTAVFPWFAMARGTVSIIAHAIFGLAVGYSYHALAKPRPAHEPGGRASAH